LVVAHLSPALSKERDDVAARVYRKVVAVERR
jgi:hypothetical protein